jgi:hypothetical protein
MSVTIGAFSTKTLRAQPFGYEGDARQGRTATIIEFTGLVKPSEWLTFKGVYDGWRNLRINDEDTAVSKAVGTTVVVSASANGVTWTNKPCWFTEAPSASQVGAYVEVSATLVDAAEALAVFLKEEDVEVDCAKILADLQRDKDETDCEIAALQTGLVDDFADQDVTLELLRGNAELNAKEAFKGDIAELSYKNEVQEKQGQVAEIAAYATTIAGLDEDLELAQSNADLASYTGTKRSQIAENELDLEVLQRNTEFSARAARVNDLAELDYKFEVQEKTAQKEELPAYADTIASLDLDLDLISRNAELLANEPKKGELAELDYKTEVQTREGQLLEIDNYAGTIAALDEDLGLAQSNANLASFTAGKRAQLAGNEYDLEILQNTAEITALSSRLTALKASRELRALYDKELSEDLPNYGSQTLGGAVIQLTEPAESRAETPSFTLTATGNALISGALKPVRALNISGVLTSGTISSVFAWYDTAVSSTPAPGALFPSGPPTFETESVLVSGAKGSRTSVQISVIQIPA